MSAAPTPPASTPSRAERSRLRAEARANRRAVPPAQRRAAARRMAAHLGRSGWLRPGTRIALYVSTPEEADSAACLALALRRHCRLYLPRVLDLRRGRMRFAAFGGPMRRNAFGIPEPLGSEAIGARWLDLVLVPTVAFDARGGRLGMGAGYYDRALEFRRRLTRWRGPRIVGLAFDCQQVARIPLGPHDIPLDAIVTESGVRRFPRGTPCATG